MQISLKKESQPSRIETRENVPKADISQGWTPLAGAEHLRHKARDLFFFLRATQGSSPGRLAPQLGAQPSSYQRVAPLWYLLEPLNLHMLHHI